MFGAYMEVLAGDLAAAERELRGSYSQLEQLGERAFLSTIAAMLGRVLCEQERFDEAEPYAVISAETALPEDLASQVIWRGAQARVLAARGEASSETLARESVELAGRSDWIDLHADALTDLADVFRLLGRPQDATEPHGARDRSLRAQRAVWLPPRERAPGSIGLTSGPRSVRPSITSERRSRNGQQWSWNAAGTTSPCSGGSSSRLHSTPPTSATYFGQRGSGARRAGRGVCRGAAAGGRRPPLRRAVGDRLATCAGSLRPGRPGSTSTEARRIRRRSTESTCSFASRCLWSPIAESEDGAAG